ncbi:MAG: hypothetical protein A2Y76_12910 [Planctomycetes bacterium RBG_13_60_9]|nr:MAG: hypothetical protein A2Y76_12910 [Planctomycetes bacterium RBG_13_60_9]
MKSHSESFSAWSSLLSVFSFPLIVIGLVVGYNEIADLATSPDPELTFVHPSSVAYKVMNRSAKTAEDVLVSFGIFDIDSTSQQPLPLASVNYDYVNKHSETGPFRLLGDFGQVQHRYLGIVYIGCRGGERLRTYWIYVTHGNGDESFFAERGKKDVFEVDIAKAAKDPVYLQTLIPKNRRKPIGP